jgi:hypothetical protein
LDFSAHKFKRFARAAIGGTAARARDRPEAGMQTWNSRESSFPKQRSKPVHRDDDRLFPGGTGRHLIHGEVQHQGGVGDVNTLKLLSNGPAPCRIAWRSANSFWSSEAIASRETLDT